MWPSGYYHNTIDTTHTKHGLLSLFQFKLVAKRVFLLLLFPMYLYLVPKVNYFWAKYAMLIYAN